MEVIIGASFGDQKLQLGVINVMYHFVKQGTAGAYGTKNLTNIKVQIRDCMSKIQLKVCLKFS